MEHDDHTHSPNLIVLVVIGAPLGLVTWVGLWWLIEFIRRHM